MFRAYASKEAQRLRGSGAESAPRERAKTLERREEAAVPEEVGFAHQRQAGQGDAPNGRFDAGVPARWAVADTVNGTARDRGNGWKAGCSTSWPAPATQGVYDEGRQWQARTVAKHLPEEEGSDLRR